MTTQTNDKAAPSLATSNDEDVFAAFRLDQSMVDNVVGVTKMLHTVPMKKPAKTEFFRVHPDHYFDAYTIELKDVREFYLATPQVALQLAEFVEPCRLRYCISKQNNVFIWPMKLPKDDRRRDNWRQSALEAAQLAESKWVRISADMALGAYQCFAAVADLGDPKWPQEGWKKVMEIGLRGLLISSMDHDIVQRLVGAKA
jgi:hypothetical protein